jgi:arylsulfatase/uncharacterized sulfatase
MRVCRYLAGERSIAGALACVAFCSAVAAAQAHAARPNVILILADDVGFTDFAPYGGEARMPNISRLAERGARFSSYHTSPLCAPSRAMLLTGVDNHRTGVATIPEVLPAEHQGRPGYTMHFEPGVVTVAERLRAAGYRTYMSGKWHLGQGEGDLPNSHGFDRSLALDASGADNWEQKPYMPYYRTADWFEDGERTTLPRDFYSSELLVDRLIEYIEADAERTEPFFAYLAFQAVHIPVQAPREFTDNYDGVYDAGWNALQAQRWRRAQALGLVRDGAPMPAMHERMRSWESINPDEQRLYARSMQVHAGMLEAMDHHIGRLVAHLEARGLAENTIFLVTSDNGPEPSDPLAQAGFAQWMTLHGYTRRLADLGERRSLVYIGPEWASATASPGSLFKFYASEGGLRVPLIAAGPGVAVGHRVSSFTYVTDLAPTILDYAGLPVRSAEGEAPISGRSLRAALGGDSGPVHPDDAPVGVEVSGHAALYRGDLKITRNMPPYGNGDWRLFDIAADPGETRDLAATHPELMRAMLRDYDTYARSVGVLELPEGYDVHWQIARNTIAKQFGYYWWVLAIVVATLGGLAFAISRRVSRRR